MNVRIREVRRDAGLTQEEFAKRIGLTKNYISLVETGERNMGDRAVKDLCEIFGVSYEWLKTGNGEKYARATVVKQLSDIFDALAHDPEDSFRRAVFLGLAQLDPDDWEMLRGIVEKILGK